MPRLPHNFKVTKGQWLTPPSTPGYFVEVKDFKVDFGKAYYVVEELEGSAWREIELAFFEQYYRPVTRWERKIANDIVDPPPPKDPDFDEDGFPTFISDRR
jgi:hypothetical protein